MRSIKFVIGMLAVIIFLVAVLVGEILFFQKKATPKYTYNMSSQTVITEMRKLNRLETASYTIEKVIDAGTNGNAFQQFLLGDRILLIAHGEAIAGIDMSKMEDNAVKIDGSTIHMTLPAPEILVTKLDSDQTRVYDRQQGLLTKGDKDLESQARAEAEKVIGQAACQGNILNEASDNARKQLTALLKTLGFVTVVIDIPAGSCTQ